MREVRLDSGYMGARKQDVSSYLLSLKEVLAVTPLLPLFEKSLCLYLSLSGHGITAKLPVGWDQGCFVLYHPFSEFGHYCWSESTI